MKLDGLIEGRRGSYSEAPMPGLVAFTAEHHAGDESDHCTDAAA